MAKEASAAFVDHFHVLYTMGTARSLSDSQLLELFQAGGRRGEAAFEALVARHGPMVLGVCRRVLGDGHDVQDAYQATFLVLVRKAGSLRDRELLANWLYGVAGRVAGRARADAAKRRANERRAAELSATTEKPRHDDLRGLLDEEIGRLPQKYRDPVVLCLMEGMRHEEAAQHLGCPVGTVESRLSRARERLRDRLTRRGLAPVAGALIAGLAPDRASAAALLGPALAVGSKGSALPPQVVALAGSALKTMGMVKVAAVAAGLVAGGFAACAVGPIAGRGLVATPAAANPASPERVHTADRAVSGEVSSPAGPESPRIAAEQLARNPGEGPALDAPFRAETPIADGIIEDGEYGPFWDVFLDADSPAGRAFSIAKQRLKHADDLSYRVAAAHTDRSLFLAFDVRDQAIDDQDKDRGSPHLNDSVEVFLDGDRRPNDFSPNDNGKGSREGFQLLADVAGHRLTVASGFGNDDWKAVARRSNKGYTIEFEIPLSLIDTVDGPGFEAARTGSILNFNAAVNDNDQPVSAQTHYSVLWSDAEPGISPFVHGESTWKVRLRLTP